MLDGRRSVVGGPWMVVDVAEEVVVLFGGLVVVVVGQVSPVRETAVDVVVAGVENDGREQPATPVARSRATSAGARTLLR